MYKETTPTIDRSSIIQSLVRQANSNPDTELQPVIEGLRTFGIAIYGDLEEDQLAQLQHVQQVYICKFRDQLVVVLHENELAYVLRQLSPLIDTIPLDRREITIRILIHFLSHVQEERTILMSLLQSFDIELTTDKDALHLLGALQELKRLATKRVASKTS